MPVMALATCSLGNKINNKIMEYDFNEEIERRGTNSYKWDSCGNSEVLPMWVADMDFKTAPPIIEALHKRVEHGIFGYVKVPETYYDAVISWFDKRHGWNIGRDWIIYTSGVVPAVSAIIKALSGKRDKVIVQTPVYNCFFSSIRNNDCKVIANPLVWDGNTYAIDYDDLQRKASDPQTGLMLLCNPHNPAGRVWRKDELERIGEICLSNDVTVIADEIHCELVFPGHKYIPFASISSDFSKHSVTCLSPSKAFNIAGLQNASIVAEDASMRELIDRAININEVCDVNPFGVEATIVAYRKGEKWLAGLLNYLKGNYEFMREFCSEHLPSFPIAELEGTYLVWMDCRALNRNSEQLEQELVENAALWLNAGTMYGEDGNGFMRWNIACPRSRLAEGLQRFKRFVEKQVQ